MTKLADSLSQWTEWTRENILPRPSLPLISGRDINTGPTVDKVRHRPPAQIRESLETFLAQHYDDIAARFVVLSFLWKLIHLEYGFKDLEAEQRVGFREILKDLVCLVDLQRLADPKIISWEIVNACSAEEWDLGTKLYNRLGDAAGLSESHFLALRGQFLYCSVDWELNLRDAEGPSSLSFWSPELEVETLRSIVMCHSATVPPERQKEPNQNQLARLRKAADDLRSATKLDPHLPIELHVMLAKSSLLTEDYPRAGEKYEDVLRENLFRVWPGDIPPFRQALYENAARCYELAERPERAESLLKACLDELPKSKGVWLKLARLHTQPPHTDYKAAYEALRQELEADPDAGEDVRMSVALTLGAIGSEGHALKQAVEQYVDRNPQQFDLTKSLVRANWPGFASLSEQAQVEWAEASWELWGLATQVQTQPTGIYRMAAQTFGLAVECELRERLYLPFREQIKRLPHVMNSAKEGLKDEATRELCRFLIDDRHLTLGPMLNAIDASRCRPRLEFLKELSRYLEKDFANLVKNFPLLKWKRLNQLYNSSKHELGGLKTEAEEMHSLCRRFLSCLTGSVSG